MQVKRQWVSFIGSLHSSFVTVYPCSHTTHRHLSPSQAWGLPLRLSPLDLVYNGSSYSAFVALTISVLG